MLIWLKYNDIFLPVKEASVTVDRGYYGGAKVSLETNDITNLKRFSGGMIDLEDGRTAWVMACKVKRTELGLVITPNDMDDIDFD